MWTLRLILGVANCLFLLQTGLEARPFFGRDKEQLSRCFDTYAFPSPDTNLTLVFSNQTQWKTNVRCVVVGEDAEDMKEQQQLPEGLKKAVDVLKLNLTEAEMQRFQERSFFFKMDEVKRTSFEAQVENEVIAVGSTDRNGFIDRRLDLSSNLTQTASSDAATSLTYGLRLPHSSLDKDIKASQAQIMLSDPSGFAIFTDIDDTIKFTQVLDYTLMFRNAFAGEYKPVAQMPELFQQLKISLASPTTRLPPSVFYVSGSPWQLIDPLRNFTQQYYGAGELRLQPFKMSVRSFIELADVKTFKSEQFEIVHEQFPQKQFYLIGDSGQKDPEIYAGLYERYGPRVVSCIWIVLTKGTDSAKEATLNDVKRFEKTFAKVPSDRWFLIDTSTTSQLGMLPPGVCRPQV